MSIAGMMIGGIILGKVHMLNREEWSAHSLAAHSLAQQGMEQSRAAKWDTMATPTVDELVQSNFPPSIEVLDIPMQSKRPITASFIESRK